MVGPVVWVKMAAGRREGRGGGVLGVAVPWYNFTGVVAIEQMHKHTKHLRGSIT